MQTKSVWHRGYIISILKPPGSETYVFTPVTIMTIVPEIDL